MSYGRPRMSVFPALVIILLLTMGLVGCGQGTGKCQHSGYLMSCTRPGCGRAAVICTPCRALGDSMCRAYCDNCGSADRIAFQSMGR